MTLYTQTNANLDTAVEAFARLSADEQLALLWFIYEEIGKSVTPAAPDAASAEIANGLFEQVKQKSYDEQLQVMRDLANRSSSLISREYGSLSANTKLAFWYALARGMDEGTIIPMPDNYELSQAAEELLGTILMLEFQQQITVLRNVVLPMGSEPAAGANI